MAKSTVPMLILSMVSVATIVLTFMPERWYKNSRRFEPSSLFVYLAILCLVIVFITIYL